MAARTRAKTGAFFAVLIGSLLVLAAGAPAVEAKRYVHTRQGQTPKPAVAVDNVCAGPNLTVLEDGTIVATIFNQPSHGSVAGDVECWASDDAGRTWQKRGSPAPHEPETNRMNVAAGLAQNGELIVISSGWSNRYPPGQSGPPFRAGILAAWLCRSSDGGRTWSVDKEAFPAEAPDGGACIPFGDVVHIAGRTIKLQIADLNVGILYIFGIASLGVFGAILAGWSSNNRYGLPQRLAKKLGVPQVIINGDLNDLRLYSEEQARTQFEALVEQIRERTG